VTHVVRLSRRQALQSIGAFAVVSGTLTTFAASLTLPSTASLQVSLDQAVRVKQPLVVMVSLHGCAFCKVVRENYLQPLRASGLQVVQIDMRDNRVLADFDGTSLTHDGWVRKQGIKLAPTVLFFGSDGREVAARLNGAYLPDFYGAYLDEQLTVARRVVSGA
jgi:thioredoxin-related protein